MSASSSVNRVRARVSWKRCLLSCSLAACFSAAFPLASAVAADGSWAVDAAGNWIDGPNWSTNPAVPGGVATTANPDTATFGSVIGAARIVTVDANRNIFKIDFAGNSSAYTLSGGSLLLSAGGSIVTSGAGVAHTDTVSSPITIQGTGPTNAAFTTGSSLTTRLLVLSGAINGSATVGNTTTLTLNGAGTGNNTVSGAISDGAGGGNLALVKDGDSTSLWILSGTNTFTGGITINSGILSVSNVANLGSVNNTITINGGILRQTTSLTVPSTNLIKIGAAGATLRNTNTSSGNSTFQGVISDVAPGAGALTVDGTLGRGYVPQAQHTYSGGTRLVSATVILNVSSTGSATTSDLVSGPFGTGTLHFDGGQMRATTTAATYTVGNAVQFNAPTTFVAGSTQQLVFNGPVKLNGTNVITAQNQGNITFSGAISDLAGTNGFTLAATSTGRIVLSGANTYTGPTTVLGGNLTLAKQVSLYNNVTANWTAANIKVASGATLQLNVGGTGEFTVPNVLALAALGNATDGFQSGANIGIDTTNATGASLDMSANPIVNPNGGANALGLSKFGAATTLVVSPNNSYTGVTSILGGTLSANSLNKVTGGTATSGLGAPTTIATGTIQAGTGTTAVGLTYTGSGETTDRVLNLAGTTGTFTLTQSGTGSLKFSSNLTATGVGSKTFTLAGSTAGTGEISGIIPDNDTTNTTGLAKSGTGTWTLSGANTYTGLTNITGGTLAYGASDVIATGPVTLNGNGATLDLGLNRTDNVGVVTLTNGTINGSGTSALTSSGSYALASGTANIPLLGTLGATKTGTGIVTLNAASNYTGLTTLAATGGVLTFGQRSGFYGGVPANWTDANFVVNTGSTLAFGVGGATGFTAADLDLLKSVATGTGGFLTGSSIGFDTTNGNFAYASTIADPAGVVLGVTKLGTNKLTLAASNTYTGLTLINQGSLAFSGDTTLANGLSIGPATGTSTVVGTLDLSTTNATINGPVVVQTNTATANTLTIGAGKTLTVNNNFTVGSSAAASVTTALNSSGGGKLLVNNSAANATFAIGGNTNSGSLTTADLSGLGELEVNLNTTTGVFRVNPNNGTNVSGKYSTLTLPATTKIVASALSVGDNGQNNNTTGTPAADQTNKLILGSGVTTLNVGALSVGVGNRDAGSITFGSASGSVVLRGTDGTSAVPFSMSGNTTTTGAWASNVFDMTGHNADLRFAGVTIGNQNRSGKLDNLFAFNQGTLEMASLSAGTMTQTTESGNGAGVARTSTNVINLGGGTTTITNGITGFGQITGTGYTTASQPHSVSSTLNISGGTVTIGATSGVSVTLGGANVTGTTNVAAIAGNGTLNLTGGSATFQGHINGGTLSGTSTGGVTRVSTLKLSGGSLNMSMQNIGGTAVANNITNLLFESGTLSNVGQINNGAGLNKTTAGTLTIAGLNTYTGVTSVSAGVLVVNGSTTSDTTVAAGATLGGSGSIAGNLTNTGLVAPGNSIGTLTVVGDATFNAGSSFTAELGAGNSSDLLNLTSVNSNLSLATATDTLNLVSTLDPGTFTIINYNGTRSGTFDAVTFNSVLQSAPIVSTGVTNPAGFTGTGDLYNYGNFAVFYNNTDTSVQVGLTAIPEPSTLVLGSLALLGLAGAGLRRRRQQQ